LASLDLELLPDTDAIDHRLTQLASEGPVAPAALQTPLLANLSAQENLELVGAFHSQKGASALVARAAQTLANLDMGPCAARRPAELTDREALMIQLARAAMRPGALAVLVTPFTQAPELDSDAPIRQAITALGLNRLCILDFPSNRHRYSAVSEVAP